MPGLGDEVEDLVAVQFRIELVFCQGSGDGEFEVGNEEVAIVLAIALGRDVVSEKTAAIPNPCELYVQGACTLLF